MRSETYRCSSCTAPIDASEINFKTRTATCPWCGQKIIFPKRNSTASPNAVHALNESVRFFFEKNYASAKSCAETVITMSPNNIPANYILAYYNAFIATVKKRISLEHLFKKMIQDTEFEIEEEELFKELLLKTLIHSMDYEEYFIAKFVEYDDPKEVAQFIERYCPISISKRSDYRWFTPNMKDAYLKITKYTDIPKTWFALLNSIAKNPDSPMVNNEFYLKTKVANFYSNYIIPLGEILNAIRNEELKKKFISAYEKMKKEIENNMK